MRWLVIAFGGRLVAVAWQRNELFERFHNFERIAPQPGADGAARRPYHDESSNVKAVTSPRTPDNFHRQMTLEEKKVQLLNALSAITNSQERFAYVVECGRKSPALSAEFKTEAYRVEGCMAKLWFVSEFREGCCYFRADSDSAIVKGIAAMLCEFYSGSPPDEIVKLEPKFLEKVGITQHLTPNRRNSLSKVWEKIRGFAESHRGGHA